VEVRIGAGNRDGLVPYGGLHTELGAPVECSRSVGPRRLALCEL
jgi:hypothetical protein